MLHMHLESTLLLPAELASLIVPLGTTAVISDSHELANVLGIAGIEMVAAASKGLAAGHVLHGIFVRSRHRLGRRGAALGAADVRQLLWQLANSRACRGDGHPRGARGETNRCSKRCTQRT